MTAEGREHCQQFEMKFTKHFHFHFSRGSFIFNFNWVNWWRHVCLICGHQSSCSRWTDRKPLFANEPENTRKANIPFTFTFPEAASSRASIGWMFDLCEAPHRSSRSRGRLNRQKTSSENQQLSGVVFYFGHHQYFCKYLLDIQPIVWHCAAPMAAGSVKIW